MTTNPICPTCLSTNSRDPVGFCIDPWHSGFRIEGAQSLRIDKDFNTCPDCNAAYTYPSMTCDNPRHFGKTKIGKISKSLYVNIDSQAPKVGDINSPAKGTGARFSQGKAALDMIPLHLLEGAARVFDKATYRAVNPYPKWNWAKGMPWTVVLGSIKRHIAAIDRGEDYDPEDLELHIDHVMCNVIMLVHYYQTYTEGDDRSIFFQQKAAKNEPNPSGNAG